MTIEIMATAAFAKRASGKALRAVQLETAERKNVSQMAGVAAVDDNIIPIDADNRLLLTQRPRNSVK